MKTLFKCMVKSLDYLTLRLPQLSYYIERDTVTFTLRDGTTGQIKVNFIAEMLINSDGEIENKKTGFVRDYKFDNQEFITIAEVVLHLANKYQLNIYFGETACDDIEALIPPFNANPFRTYTEFPRLSKAVLLFNPADQLINLQNFNRTQCQDGLNFHKVYPLTSSVISKLKQRLSAYNTAHADQMELIK